MGRLATGWGLALPPGAQPMPEPRISATLGVDRLLAFCQELEGKAGRCDGLCPLTQLRQRAISPLDSCHTWPGSLAGFFDASRLVLAIGTSLNSGQGVVVKTLYVRTYSCGDTMPRVQPSGSGTTHLFLFTDPYGQLKLRPMT